MNQLDQRASFDLPNLDMLRACAVLMVLFDHTFQSVVHASERVAWIGRLGVLFFFVHTACVLMMSLEQQAFSGQSIFKAFLYPTDIPHLSVEHGRGISYFDWF
jgi:peptidoglycan/LPS O-acetylase OafA/YrhL